MQGKYRFVFFLLFLLISASFMAEAICQGGIEAGDGSILWKNTKKRKSDEA